MKLMKEDDLGDEDIDVGDMENMGEDELLAELSKKPSKPVPKKASPATTKAQSKPAPQPQKGIFVICSFLIPVGGKKKTPEEEFGIDFGASDDFDLQKVLAGIDNVERRPGWRHK